MVISAPVFVSPESTQALAIREIDNLSHYLYQVNQTLSHLDRDRYHLHASSLARLKHTLTCLEVAQIKYSAIQKVFGIFTPQAIALSIRC